MAIKDLSDDYIDHMLLTVYDMDNILVQMRNEREDLDLRKTYSFLLCFLKKNFTQSRMLPLLVEKLGTPLFEKPTIAKVQLQLVLHFMALNEQWRCTEYTLVY